MIQLSIHVNGFTDIYNEIKVLKDVFQKVNCIL